MMDINLLVFKDSLLSYFIFTLNVEFAHLAVLMFGKHDPIFATIFALAGSVVGLTLSFLIFYALAVVLKKLLESNPGYDPAKHYINKFSPIIALLFLMPELAIIPCFFFGIAKVNPLKFILLALVFRAFNYIYIFATTEVLYS